VTRVTVIFNPDTAPFAPLFNRAIEAAAPSFVITVTLAPVHDDAAIEEAIAAQAREPGGGLIDLPESFSMTHRDAIIASAARHGLPLMCGGEVLPRAGGLMSYWFDTVEVHAEGAFYSDRILQGRQSGRPPGSAADKIFADHQPQDRQGLGLTVPPSMLDLADEVIE
jgi:putative ABC transport system substrate-binding protein